MIESKEQLAYYIRQDALADGHTSTNPKLFGGWPNTIWKYKIFMRKAEYYRNKKQKNIIDKIFEKYYLIRYTNLGIKLGYTIPLNVAQEGLSLPHYGTIVINGSSKIGKNCRIMADVCIGSTSGVNLAASIGDNVYIGAGAKIIGAIKIGNNCVIGANSVVSRDVENDVVVAGVPAKVIKKNDGLLNLSSLLFEK